MPRTRADRRFGGLTRRGESSHGDRARIWVPRISSAASRRCSGKSANPLPTSMRRSPQSSRTFARAAMQRLPTIPAGSIASMSTRWAWRSASAEIDAAIGACEPNALKALELAHARVMDYHQRQKPADVRFTDELGVELGWRWRPIGAVGLYVPGGAASYPSSVVMNAVPAKVAGCAASGDGRADAGRRRQSAGAGGCAHCRDRRDLSCRRRAGDRRARLRHADDRARRQDRRSWQRLRRGGEAARIRRSGHRHDRRTIGGRHSRQFER